MLLGRAYKKECFEINVFFVMCAWCIQHKNPLNTKIQAFSIQFLKLYLRVNFNYFNIAFFWSKTKLGDFFAMFANRCVSLVFWAIAWFKCYGTFFRHILRKFWSRKMSKLPPLLYG